MLRHLPAAELGKLVDEVVTTFGLPNDPGLGGTPNLHGAQNAAVEFDQDMHFGGELKAD